MSGYLLARSLDRPMSKADLLGFGRNRGLRILPALWICTLATFVLLAVADLLFQPQPGQLVAFVVAQMTIGQSWSPGAITEYGLGTPLTPNPALWTIRMSIAFYVALPLVLVLGPRLIPQRRRLDAAILALAAYSVYLWHMVFVNAIIHWDLASTWVAAAIVLAGSTLMAKISWHAIEAPALARKRRRPAATQPVSGPPGYAAAS